MTRLVALTRSAEGADALYDVKLGPLRFVTPADQISESIADGLEVVGAALTPAERKPRPLKLKLPVRGANLALDPRQAGLDLRRNLRELMDNARWRLQGLYFMWEADPELDGWLLTGSADMSESDPGITFGEYGLDMSEVYIVGRPGTHRPGRRAAILDRRTGLAPRDTRGRLYSTDFSSQALPTQPLVLPGDVAQLVTTGNSPVSATTLGPERTGSRHLWLTASAEEASILHYLPDPTVLPNRDRFLELDDFGSVRVWDLSGAVPYPPDPAGYSTERDEDPDIFYGWKRVLGNVLTAQAPLALDNGACRLVWLGSQGTEGLAIEYWDSATESFKRIGRVLHSLNVHEQWVVEATPERAVIEWRAGRYGMRAILQRGWWGPRLESYDDGGETARLEFAPETGTSSVTTAASTPTWVRTVKRTGGDILLWAQGATGETIGTSPTVISGAAATFTRSRVLVAQLSCPGSGAPSAEELASSSLIDARAIPVLIGRG